MTSQQLGQTIVNYDWPAAGARGLEKGHDHSQQISEEARLGLGMGTGTGHGPLMNCCAQPLEELRIVLCQERRLDWF